MTSKIKYTPGPWFIKDGSNPLQVSSEKRSICLMQGRLSEKNSRELQKNNARLIAAAPELLEALEWCVNYLETERGEDGNPIEKAEKSIAKAKGL